MVVYLSYNVAGRADLAGLKQLIIQFKPDYIFLQEMVGTKEHLDANLGGEYECQVNVDVENAKQPGCALAWRSMLEVEAVSVVPCRMQLLKSKHGDFVNVYANTGTKGEAARRVLFGQDLVSLVAARPGLAMVGDWNCITRKEDEEFSHKYSRKISPELQQLVRDGDYEDLFVKFNPGKQYFSWRRRGVNKSRLDRVYYPRTRMDEVTSFEYIVHCSDHDAVVWHTKEELTRDRQAKAKSYWKAGTEWKLPCSCMDPSSPPAPWL